MNPKAYEDLARTYAEKLRDDVAALYGQLDGDCELHLQFILSNSQIVEMLDNIEEDVVTLHVRPAGRFAGVHFPFQWQWCDEAEQDERLATIRDQIQRSIDLGELPGPDDVKRPAADAGNEKG